MSLSRQQTQTEDALREHPGRAFDGGEARRAMVAAVARLGAVTAEALAAIEDSSTASARGRLAAAERAGLIDSWRLVNGLPTLYTATARGAAAAAGLPGPAPMRLSAGTSVHAAAVAVAIAGLARAFPGRALLGEPAIRSEERERGRPFASLAGSRAVGADGAAGPFDGSAAFATGAGRHRPDLLIVERADRTLPVAVEVELTVKAPARLAAICRAWARSREVGGTIYLAAPPVFGPLARAIAAAGAEERVLMLPLATLEPAIARVS